MKFENDTEMYFKSLPSFIQETIIQSGATFNNIKELKNLAENISSRSKSGEDIPMYP